MVAEKLSPNSTSPGTIFDKCDHYLPQISNYRELRIWGCMRSVCWVLGSGFRGYVQF